MEAQLACLPGSYAQQRCRELGLPAGSGKDCKRRLLEFFRAEPRRMLRLQAAAVPLSLYKRALWILDHLPWDRLCSHGLRAVAQGNQSFSLGRTSGFWGVSHDIIKKSVRDPIARALLQVLWDTLREMAGGFQYSTAHLNRDFNGVPHVDKNNVGLSWALSLGDFTGGELVCETEDPRVLACHTTRKRPVIFDGHRPHWVLPYEGRRYSVILYTSRNGDLAADQHDLAGAEPPER